ncbi:MAG: phosphoribosyltransferase family protein [Caulobacteraceae bacterium]
MAPAWEAGVWAGRRLLDLVLPPRELLGGGSALSPGVDAANWSRIAFLEAPVCDGCGAPFPYAGDMQRCVACLARPRLFSRARAACTYDDASRDLILKLKHADRTDLAGLFTNWLSRAAADLLEDCDAVVPTPLHRWRLFRRRYNQAAEIARPLAARAGKPYLADTLLRVKPGGQGGKSASGRRRAVQGAFAVPPAKRDLVANKRILLIDDVMTTGATAEACARALLRAGAKAVDVAVVARVAEPGS